MKTFRTVLFLLILSTVCTLFLSGGQFLYLRLSSRFNIELYGTILGMFGIDAEEEEIEASFHKNFDTKTVGVSNFYICKLEPFSGTVVFKHDGPGLWSNIEILVAVKKNREELYKLGILSQAETPGMGARIIEEPFLKQFEGIEIRPDVKLVKFSIRSNEVDAISGATKTSNYLESIINKAIVKMDQSLKGGN